MTPQESELVNALFDRLAKLETLPRDGAAERVIADAGQRAPHALYALTQTVLLQDEALKRANARIEELQAQVDGAEPQQDQRQGSFLDSMRAALSPHEPRGSVPNVRANVQASGAQPQPGYFPPAGAPAAPGYPAGAPFGAGGSFLGTAASTAAGMIGGGLLLDGIRSMFGQRAGAASALSNLGSGQASPWGGGADTRASAANSDLAREAGVDDIGSAGRRDRDAAADTAADTNTGADSDPFAGDGDRDDADVGDDNDFDDADMDSGGSYDV
jgi:uncharacterized protein